jgi:hypothetical protein
MTRSVDGMFVFEGPPELWERAMGRQPVPEPGDVSYRTEAEFLTSFLIFMETVGFYVDQPTILAKWAQYKRDNGIPSL